MQTIAQFREIPPLSQGLIWLAGVLLLVLMLTWLLLWLSRRKH